MRDRLKKSSTLLNMILGTDRKSYKNIYFEIFTKLKFSFKKLCKLKMHFI